MSLFPTPVVRACALSRIDSENLIRQGQSAERQKRQRAAPKLGAQYPLQGAAIRGGEAHHPLAAIQRMAFTLLQPANKAPGTAVVTEQTRARIDGGPGQQSAGFIRLPGQRKVCQSAI